MSRLRRAKGCAALGLAELRVEGRGLDLELLDDVGGRHVRGGHLVPVGAEVVGRAVDGDVVQAAARAAHGKVDDVGRLEGAVQADAAVKGDAGGKPISRKGLP